MLIGRYDVGVLLLFSIVFSVPLNADNKPEIQWFYQEFPPVYIVEGPLAGQGYGDRTVKFFIERLPEYSHTRVMASYSRTVMAMEARRGACHGGLFRSEEREKVMLFSEPSHRLIANRVIILKEGYAALKPFLSHGGVNLIELMAFSKLKLGYVDSRIYSPRINKVLDAHKTPTNSLQIPFNLFAKMLLRGRVDYVFGYPVEAAYQFNVLKSQDMFMTVPIRGEPLYLSARIACDKSEAGYDIIDRVNAIIKAEGDVPTYFHYYARWLDENSLATYRAVVASLAKNDPTLAETLGQNPEVLSGNAATSH